MTGERTPAPHGDPPRTNDDEISLREHMQRQIDVFRDGALIRVNLEREHTDETIAATRALLEQSIADLAKRLEEADIHGATHATYARSQLQQGIADLAARLDERFQVAMTAQRERVIEEDKRYEQRFQSQEKAVELALARVDKEFHEHLVSVREETQAALEAADKAIHKSETATEKRFECVSADTPILCADLIWRPAGELLVGDEIIGMDEHPLDGDRRRGRRFRRAVVTDNSLARDALLLVTTPEGAVRCNRNHPWLARPSDRTNWRWVQAEDLQPGDTVARPVDTWAYDRSWESGWLAGMYDGEGCLSMGNGRVQLSLSQRESPTSDTMIAALKERLGKAPLTYRLEPGGPSTSNNTQPFFHVLVTSRPDVMKILGSVRPPRLLARADEVWEGKVIGSRGSRTTVTSVEPVGTGLIAQLSTSTGTYIAAGFAMHNSVNEFRAQLAEQAQSFMPRKESDVRMEGLSEKVDANAERLNALQLQVTSRLDLTQGASTGGREAIVEKRATNAAVYAAVGFGISLLLALITVVGVLLAVKP